jgi:hypothetical protein
MKKKIYKMIKKFEGPNKKKKRKDANEKKKNLRW